MWRYAAEEASYNPRSRQAEWFDDLLEEDGEDDEDEEEEASAVASSMPFDENGRVNESTLDDDDSVEEELRGTGSTETSSSEESPTSPAVDYGS